MPNGDQGTLEPRKLTVRDLLALSGADNIEIWNETNEPLISLCETNFAIPNKTAWLNDSLLDREAIKFWQEGPNHLIIKVKGFEDAE